MTPNEIIYNMLKMQQSLNDETNGLGWENGYTNKNKLINWKRCIYMECAELIENFAWKHWKDINAPTDEQNLKVEVVDIWHFVMSLALQNYRRNGLDMQKLTRDIESSSGFAEFCKEAANVANESIYEIINDAEMLIHKTSGFDFELSDLLKIYFTLALKCGVNLYSLYECYVAKNVLNRFRQDHGYKEGGYKKIWNGVEDNVVMGRILADGVGEITEIYAALKREYSKID